MTKETLREKLADLEHEQWAHWTVYMLDNLTKENLKRWGEQVATSYSQLSEKEKDSDRIWADKVLGIFKEHIQNAERRLKEELFKEMKSIKYIRCYDFVEEKIDKIFKEEFGDDLI